jgi:HK97 family phage major capsid protein
MDETLIAFGGAVKFLDDDKTTIGGFLVRYTSPEEPDASNLRDYFTKDTDFGIEPDGAKLPLYYQHGFDPVLRNTKIGKGTLKSEEKGLWLEAQIEISDQYRNDIVAMIDEGRLGYSSGAAPHLVSRSAAKNNTHHVKSWPLAEGSLTPNPADPMNIVSMKSLAEAFKALQLSAPEPEPEAKSEGDQPDTAATEQAQPPKTQTKTMETPTPAVPETPEVDVKAMVADLVAKALAETEIKKAPALAAPTIIPTGNLGDSEKKAFDHWVRTGDAGGVKHLIVGKSGRNNIIEMKASNATDMNVGTAADGGNAVQQGIFPGIIARRDEMLLASKLGVRRFTGTGTVLDVPTDNEADGEFVTKSEATAFDQDSPAIGQTVLTLAKYTKYMDVSDELLEDSSANILEFVNEWVSRGMAKTHNTLLVAESVANGTQLDTAATASISLGDLEAMAYNNDLGGYLDQPGTAWLMRPATYGSIISVGGTSNRYYAPTAQGQPVGRTLLEMPVEFSQKCDAYGVSNARSIHFANWFSYMGLYESPSVRFVRDPFTVAISGQTRLLWNFRCDYGVLQAEAGGFLRHLTT